MKLALRLELWMPGVAGVGVGRPGDDPRVRSAGDDAELADDAEALLGLHVARGEVVAAVDGADGVDAPAAVQLGDVAGDPVPGALDVDAVLAVRVRGVVLDHGPLVEDGRVADLDPRAGVPAGRVVADDRAHGELADLDAGAERPAGVVRLDRRPGRLADRDAARVPAEVVALDERVGGELDADAGPGRRR